MDQEYTPKDEVRPGYPEQDPGIRGLTSTDLEALIRQQVAEEEARQEHVRATGGLSDYHRNVILKDRAITLEIAKAAGLRTHVANTAEYRQWRKKYGLPREPEDIEQLEGAGTYPVDGIFIPYQAGELGRMVYWRLRYDDTTFRTWSNEMDESGISGCWETAQCPRYHGKPGTPVCPYIPALIDSPEARAAFGFNDAEPLFVTEAPLKCLSLYSQGFKGVGLGGVLAGCHQKRVDKRLKVTAHSEMRRINWHDRRCYTAFDAGQATNPLVALGVAYVWQALSALGADVHTVTIPERAPGRTAKERDQGPDDFLAARGKEAFQDLVEAAYETDPLARVAEVASITETREKTRSVIALSRDLVFRACLSLLDAASLKEVARVGKGLFTQKDLKDLVASFRAAMIPKDAQEAETSIVELGNPSNADVARVLVTRISNGCSPSLTHLEALDRMVGDLGSVWAYDDIGVWNELNESRLSREVQAIDGARVKGTERRWYVQSTAPVLDMIRARIDRPRFFAEGPRGVAFRNGFVRLDNGQIAIESHGIGNRVRWAYDFDYLPNPNPTATWAYFRRVFRGDPDCDEKAIGMLEYAGCGILGMGSHFNKAFLLFDEFGGGTGKSQWLQLLHDGKGVSLYPPGSVVSIPPHKFCAAGNTGDFHRAMLAGKRANIVNELPSAELSDDDTFKAMTDGNPMTGRRSGMDPFQFVFEGSQWYAGNGLMGVFEQTDAFFDRWVLIHYRNRIRDSKDEVRHYYLQMWEERAHVVSACIQAAAAAVKRGHLTIPDSSRHLIGKWREETNVVAGFVREKTVPVTRERQPFDGTNKYAMWPIFKDWSEATRQSAKMGRSLFFKRLTALVGEPTKYEHRNAYPFRLRTPDELLEEGPNLKLVGGVCDVSANDVDDVDVLAGV
jgi:phage/plasmid-associated DNA primase